MIFETHAHYDDEAFDGDRDTLLGQMAENNIETIINVSSDFPSCQRTLDLSERYSFIYAALGIHPDEIGGMNEEKLSWIEEKCRGTKVVAIGEIGLDYYWDKEGHDVQKDWFVKQIEMARRVKLPIIVHTREAAKETYETMKEANAGEIGGVVHCFGYSREMAREFLDLDFHLGIGGVVTFKNARKVKEAVEYAPLDRILLETDSPYLAPVPFRGKRNCSLYLPYVAEAIAEIKKVPVEEVCEITRNNARRLFLAKKCKENV